MMSRSVRFLFAAGLALSLSTLPVRGQGKGKGHDKTDKHDQAKGDGGTRAYELYGFRPRDREVVTSYYTHRRSGLPPGLAKRNGSLPPGLEKQLERNGTLPPGLQKKLQPCPVEISRELPPLPPAYQRGVIGAHVVIFNKSTNVIVDVMKDVVR